MKFTFTVNLGNTPITFEDTADTNIDFVEKASFYMDLPTTCGLCNSGNLKVQHRVAQDFDFYSVKCADCGAELKFGQAKEGRRLFPKAWDKYEPGVNSETVASEDYNPAPAPRNVTPSTTKAAAAPSASTTPKPAAAPSLAERAANIRNKVGAPGLPNLRR